MSSPPIRSELVAGLALVGVSARSALTRRTTPFEVAVFRAANDLPNGLHPPVWTVMQLGTLGAGPVLGAVAWRAGRRGLAARMVLGATASWAIAKGVKRVVRRGRPAALVPGIHIRGQEATGGGYLSGHAAVATALMTAAASASSPKLGGLAVAVGVARMYVGAHLPLDVIGGFGLGLAVDATVRQYLRGRADAGRTTGIPASRQAPDRQL